MNSFYVLVIFVVGNSLFCQCLSFISSLGNGQKGIVIWRDSYVLPYSIICFLVNLVKFKVNYSLSHSFSFVELSCLNYRRVECPMHLLHWSEPGQLWPLGTLGKISGEICDYHI